jgi:hypothetical protein
LEELQPQKKHFAAVPNHLKINSGLFAKRFAEQVLSRTSRGKHSDEAKNWGRLEEVQSYSVVP